MAAFVAGLGTGGTLMGNARRFKEEDPDTLIVAAEPLQGELVQGLRSLEDGYIPPIIDLSLLDRKIFVSNRDAVVWTKKLMEEEGLFVGVSTGAIASICVRVADEARRGQRRLHRAGRRLEVPELGRLQQDDRAARGGGHPRARLLLVAGRARRRRSRPRGAARCARLRLGALCCGSSYGSARRRRRLAVSDSFSSRMPRPTERAASGSLCGPSTISATTRITISSSGPGAEMKPIAPQVSPPGSARRSEFAQRDAVRGLAGHDRPERLAESASRSRGRASAYAATASRLELEREAREGSPVAERRRRAPATARSRAGCGAPPGASACSSARDVLALVLAAASRRARRRSRRAAAPPRRPRPGAAPVASSSSRSSASERSAIRALPSRTGPRRPAARGARARRRGARPRRRRCPRPPGAVAASGRSVSASR